MRINWWVRFHNKTFLASFLALVIAFVYNLLALFGVTPTVQQDALLTAVNAILTVLGMIGVERLSGSVLNRPFIGEILLALAGLIPNCSVSVVITESYLSGLIGLGGLFAGLLSNAGIGLLVLFRTNKNLKENLVITSTLYGLSAAAGIVITLVSGLL